MRKNLFWWQFAGFTFVCLLGSLLHFLYDWTGGSIVVAPISAVNESTWEHMKLFFFPALIFAIIEYYIVGKIYPNYWSAKVIGITIGLVSIPIIYYTTIGAFGMSPDWVNVMIFFLSSGIAFVVESYLMLRNYPNFSIKIAIIILVLIAIAFVVLTFVPPSIPLFIDPTTGLKGI